MFVFALSVGLIQSMLQEGYGAKGIPIQYFSPR